MAHTKSRQEKALAEYLGARGVEHFLPLIRRVRYCGRRKFASMTPLFPGYVFLRGDLEVAYMADRTDRVVRVLEVPDQDRLETELGSIRLALEQDAGLESRGYPVAGTAVEVIAGPLRGVRGIVERGAAEDRLVLGVRMLGRAAELEIDRSLLVPVE